MISALRRAEGFLWYGVVAFLKLRPEKDAFLEYRLLFSTALVLIMREGYNDSVYLNDERGKTA